MSKPEAAQLPRQLTDDEPVVHVVTQQVGEPSGELAISGSKADAVPVPLSDRQQSPGAEDPPHLGHGRPGVVQVKQDLGGDDPVEGRVGEGQLAGIAHLERDVVLSRAVPLKRLSDERRAQIDTDGPTWRPQPTSGTRKPARRSSGPNTVSGSLRACSGVAARARIQQSDVERGIGGLVDPAPTGTEVRRPHAVTLSASTARRPRVLQSPLRTRPRRR